MNKWSKYVSIIKKIGNLDEKISLIRTRKVEGKRRQAKWNTVVPQIF